MSQRRQLQLAVVAAGLLLLAPQPATATLIVPMRDAALVDRADLVVVADAVGIVPQAGERPATDYLFEVRRVLKGELASSGVVVRVLGGSNAEGLELKIFGAPRFEVGERALLFLGAERPDGARRILQFLQGAFHQIRIAERTVALQDLSEVTVLTVPGPSRPPRVRDFDKFADWIADRGRGLRRNRDYLFRPVPGTLNSVTEEFTYFDENGVNYRWFEFDAGISVLWRAHQAGQPGLDGGGFADFQSAIAAWNAEPQTPIRLVYGGTTAAQAGFQNFDNQNVILWNDLSGDIEDSFDCNEGGTLAVGGPWSDSTVTGKFNGKTYIRIQGGDIVMNDGIECRLARSPDPHLMIQEVTAHELGHTLGLGHSSENEVETNQTLRQALMYYRAHDDRRGARLESDDYAAIRGLYTKASGGGGGGNSGCPPGMLCLLHGRFQVSVTWRNQFNGDSGAGGAIADTDLAGFFYFTDKKNIELIVKILDFGSEIKVFYSQLTNFEFEMTVVDTLTGATKTYENTAGDCGAIDHAAFATAAPPGGSLTGESLAVISEAACRPDADTLCLLDDRFAIEVTWRNQYSGATGVGAARRLSNLTGAFSFTQPSNLEILIKTLDFGDRILVIYGSLSDFEYAIRVTDTATGAVNVYQNAPGNFCGGIDDDAF